jgi:predicted peroxiredoxin
MRTVGIVVGMAVLFSVGVVWPTAGVAAAKDSPDLVLNVTSGQEDLHAVTMALQLAGHGLNAGREVTLFLNVRAPALARKDLSDKVAFHGNPPLQKMLTDLMARGARIIVCPACATVMGVSETDLLPGVKLATREALFDRLGPDAVVFSY